MEEFVVKYFLIALLGGVIMWPGLSPAVFVTTLFWGDTQQTTAAIYRDADKVSDKYC